MTRPSDDNSTPSPQEIPAEQDQGIDQELLTAYLDGELDEPSRLEVETRLENETGLRKEFEKMRDTWQQLDSLEISTTNQRLVQSTLEMVAVKAEATIQMQKVVQKRRKRAWDLIGMLILFAATGLGYLAISALLKDPNEKLIANLPLIQRIGQFQQIDDFDFLNQLVEQRVFDNLSSPELLREDIRIERGFDRGPRPPMGSTPPSDSMPETSQSEANSLIALPEITLPIPEEFQRQPSTALMSESERRAYIENLSPEARAELRDSLERFEALSQSEQDTLKSIFDQIQSSPDPDHCYLTMAQYYFWLATLQQTPRWELKDKPPEKRIPEISKMILAQRSEIAIEELRNPMNRLPTELRNIDAEPLIALLTGKAVGQAEELLKPFPEIGRHQILEALKGENHILKKRSETLLLWRYFETQASQTSTRSAEDLTEIRASLPDAAAEFLAEQAPDSQWRYIGAVVFTHFANRSNKKSPYTVTEKELADFFENDLSKSDREIILNLPPDETRQAILKAYLGLPIDGGGFMGGHGRTDFNPPPGFGGRGPGPGFPGTGVRGPGNGRGNQGNPDGGQHPDNGPRRPEQDPTAIGPDSTDNLPSPPMPDSSPEISVEETQETSETAVPNTNSY